MRFLYGIYVAYGFFGKIEPTGEKLFELSSESTWVTLEIKAENIKTL